jgi:putative phosphoesterase
MRIGLISDTHRLLRPEAVAFLRGCDRIVHAGDICDPEILTRLAEIAPVTAVRGNNDTGAWADALPHDAQIECAGLVLYAIHDLAELDVDPRAAGVHVVVSGHSHKPAIRDIDGVLYVNPGSAGPRRFRLPISIGELRIVDGRIVPRIVELTCG